MPRLIGATRAKELIFTGRNVHAQEALALGLACQVLPTEAEAEDAAHKLAGNIAASAPIALRMAKAAIDDGFAVDLATGLKIEEHCYKQVRPSGSKNSLPFTLRNVRTIFNLRVADCRHYKQTIDGKDCKHSEKNGSLYLLGHDLHSFLTETKSWQKFDITLDVCINGITLSGSFA